MKMVIETKKKTRLGISAPIMPVTLKLKCLASGASACSKNVKQLMVLWLKVFPFSAR